MNKKKFVVVGGGTGTHTVLRGLRQYVDSIDITAIVSMADSGGSTGRLRDEFGQLPVGDVRNALTALAADGDEHDQLLRQLFSYRFDRGKGLSGHNFGNLLLTALIDILGSEIKAIEATSKILRVAGRVIPVTTDNIHLVAEYEDGKIVIGENDIDDPDVNSLESRIINLSVTPKANLTSSAKEALLNADLIIFGPGDLYTSVLANCVVEGFKEVINQSQAKIVYVCNLMSKKGQTVGMTASDHLKEVSKYVGKTPDSIIVNNTIFPEELLNKYKEEGEFPVLNNCMGDTCTVYAESVVAMETIQLVGGDILKRSLIRHDPDRLASILIKLV